MIYLPSTDTVQR